MPFKIFSFLLFFYIFAGGIPVYYEYLDVLGEMDRDIYGKILVYYFFAWLLVWWGYKIGVKIPVRDGVVMFFDVSFKWASFYYSIISIVLFFIGVQLYGGYYAYMISGYDPVFSGSAEDGAKQILVATAGLVAVFSCLSFYKDFLDNHRKNYIPLCLSVFVLMSLFLQGRREYIMLLLFCFFVFYIVNKKNNFRKVLKILLLLAVVFFLGFLGLYVRQKGEIEGAAGIYGVALPVVYETHFTLATIANAIAGHDRYGYDYGGFFYLLKPLLYLVPRFFFDAFGFSKSDVFDNVIYASLDNKGGQFIFSDAYIGLGFFGVVLSSLFYGVILGVVWKCFQKSRSAIVIFPIVALLFVAMRKDIYMAVKYIFLLIEINLPIFLVKKFSVKRGGGYDW